MTTTQQPPQQPTRKPTRRGSGIEWRERNYIFFIPGYATPAKPPKVLFLGRERYVFMFYVKKIVPVDTVYGCVGVLFLLLPQNSTTKYLVHTRII
jgi:hypothetical protein